jgi:hypothetical protein
VPVVHRSFGFRRTASCKCTPGQVYANQEKRCGRHRLETIPKIERQISYWFVCLQEMMSDNAENEFEFPACEQLFHKQLKTLYDMSDSTNIVRDSDGKHLTRLVHATMRLMQYLDFNQNHQLKTHCSSCTISSPASAPRRIVRNLEVSASPVKTLRQSSGSAWLLLMPA